MWPSYMCYQCGNNERKDHHILRSVYLVLVSESSPRGWKALPPVYHLIGQHPSPSAAPLTYKMTSGFKIMTMSFLRDFHWLNYVVCDHNEIFSWSVGTKGWARPLLMCGSCSGRLSPENYDQCLSLFWISTNNRSITSQPWQCVLPLRWP